MLAAVVITVLGALGLLAAPDRAQAAPSSGSSSPEAEGPDRPVAINLTRLEPRTLTLGGTVELAGTLTNDSDDTISDVSLRLQRGARLTDRQQLGTDAADPSPAGTAQAPFVVVPGELDPGDSLSFTYMATSAQLSLSTDGVYPLLVNANGSRQGMVQRVAELSTYLVVQPPVPTSRTTVAWLWPLVDQPHRDATGAFLDDELAGVVASGGRLDRALAVLEQLPDDGVGVPVTLAVDPALVEALGHMAAGYTVDGGPGQGTTAATDWLARLRALAAVHPVLALPYADVDADALQAAGLSAVLTRSLPGTPAGTAAQPVDAAGEPVLAPTPDGPPTPATAGGPDSPGDDGPGDAGDAGAPAAGGPAAEDPQGDGGVGAQILTDALGVTPLTDLAWPVGGAVRGDTLATLRAGGVDQVVLSATGYRDVASALGLTGDIAAARVPVDTDTGQLTTLVSDPALDRVVAAAGTAPHGPRVAEQRYLAELGVLTEQLAAATPTARTAPPAGPGEAPPAAAPATAQTVLVVPPREVDADPAWATAMLADTATQPWLGAASLEQLAAGPQSEPGTLAPPAPAQRLGDAGMRLIAQAVAVRDDIASAVVADPAAALAGYDAAIARASASSWRDDRAGFVTSAANLAVTVDALRGQVTLLSPADGAYSLASSDAPLVLTARNDLPFAVSVRLALSTRNSVRFSADDVELQVLQPGTRTTITVPSEVGQSGSFTVGATLSTPAGGALGQPVQLRVTSTVYGPIALGITIGAAVLLGLLFLRRLVLFVLRRRRGDPRSRDTDVLLPAAGPGADAEGRAAGPPTARSRV